MLTHPHAGLPEPVLARLRAHFPVLQQQVNGHPLIYLDNAATTQKPTAVLEVLDEYYRCSNANVHRASHALSSRATAAFEDARECVRRFVNAAHSEEIIWTKGATEAINLVAFSFGELLSSGDEIVLTTMEHHANIVPWQQLARRRGLILRVLPVTATGELDLGELDGLINPRTRLVALCHVSNALGTVNPLPQVISAARSVGARVLVDGAQAVSHFGVDVQALDCDFYLFSGHKMFAPTGIGVLYGKRELLEQMPVWQTGGEMIRRVSFTETEFNDLPFKFEPGTPHISGAIALAAAIRFLEQQDRASLQRHEQALLGYARARLGEFPGIKLVGTAADAAGVVSFLMPEHHIHDVAMLLDMQGIAIRAGHHCAMPLMQHLGLSGTLRASFSFYNSFAEVDALIGALHKIEEFL